jgi:hypothetical protein
VLYEIEQELNLTGNETIVDYLYSIGVKLTPRQTSEAGDWD